MENRTGIRRRLWRERQKFSSCGDTAIGIGSIVSVFTSTADPDWINTRPDFTVDVKKA